MSILLKQQLNTHKQQLRAFAGMGGGGGGLDLKLAQELVSARVSADSASRRAQLAESERLRVQRTLEETQVCACM
jgi:hypothetical protein